MTVSELGERQLLAAIRARLNTVVGASADLVIGIGDDAAVVSAGRNRDTVLTTDVQVETVHFDRRFSAPADIGHRALAVNLSDLAAMGAAPRWALLSLVLPDGFTVADVEGLVDGVARLGACHRTVVIGGNLSRSPGPLMVDITAVGEVRPRRALTRGGGRPGDELFVSGTVGGAAAGLEMLRESGAHADQTSRRSCIERYLRPEPRVRLGVALADARAVRAAMDLSDGLADGVHQLGESSGCGVEVDAAQVPIEAAAREWWRAQGKDPVVAALTAGDDYELVVASPREWSGRLRHACRRVADPPLTRVGRLTKDRDARVLLRESRRDELPAGFRHW